MPIYVCRGQTLTPAATPNDQPTMVSQECNRRHTTLSHARSCTVIRTDDFQEKVIIRALPDWSIVERYNRSSRLVNGRPHPCWRKA